ncbi:hypothetical protein ABPG77_005530 [Micractinium sp. CCAP 211/92]
MFVIGVSVAQPAVLGPQRSPLHAALAVLLAFNILFHFAACTLRAPGSVAAHLRRSALDSRGNVRRGALDGCRYCDACAFYKPQAAHHCRSCGSCVMQMDHHCWYLNSCVGADTLRHFILLLAWLAVALAYCLGLGLVMGFKYRAAILAHTRQLARVRRGAPLLTSSLPAGAGLLPGWHPGMLDANSLWLQHSRLVQLLQGGSVLLTR